MTPPTELQTHVPIRRRFAPPRLTIGTMMILVAVVAADFSAMEALTRGEPSRPPLWFLTGLLVVLYDLLLYCALLALRIVLRPEAGGRPSRTLLVATALVLAVFVAIPVGALVMILWRS